MLVWTQVSEEAPKHACNVIVEPLPDSDSEWCVGRTLAVLHDGRVPLRLCNPNPYPVEVPQRHVVEVEVRHIGTVGSTDATEPHPALTLQGDGLTPDQQRDMTNLLHKWSKAFAS